MNENVLPNGSWLKKGEYEIISAIGSGGFGITYLAIQTGLQRQVAIKEFFISDCCRREFGKYNVCVCDKEHEPVFFQFMEKFYKEAHTIASLSNEHTIKIIDLFKENKTAYYVMEYIDGISLYQYVRNKGPVSEQETIHIISQVADALQDVHQKKILHLDVKPANVMLRQSETGIDAVLIDFGISKRYTDDGRATSIAGQGAYSIGYSPMEQLTRGGLDAFAPATDIYSLAATMFYMLTGNNPPSAFDVAKFGLDFGNVTVSEVVKQAIGVAMLEDKNDRPQSATDFVAILYGKKSFEARVSVPQKKKDKSSKVNASVDYELYLDRFLSGNTTELPQDQLEEMRKQMKKQNTQHFLWNIVAVIFVILATILYLLL